MRVDPEDQVVRYADVGGRSVAWSAVGHGPPLVVGGWWSSHLEQDWADPAFRRFISVIAERFMVVRYDRPGTGLSDRGVGPPDTLDGELALLEHIVGKVPGPVSIFGASSGGPVSVRFAVRHPEAVQRLILYGTYAEGAGIAPPAARQTMLDLVARHWGMGTRMFAEVFMPDGTAAERDAFARAQRRSATPEAAVASLRAVYSFDVTDDLAGVRVPTLVLHRRGDRAIPFALGKDVAARIPGARFVELEGIEHFPWRGDVDALIREILGFLGARVPPPAVSPERPPLTQRETQVLALVAAGRTDAQIAEELVLSPHTVHRHVANIRTKLRVPSRAAAAAEWAAGQVDVDVTASSRLPDRRKDPP